MAIELITGRAGTPHVDSADVGAFNAAMFGGGVYTVSGCAATLADANHVQISAGELMCEGRHIRITGSGETLTIDNGLSGYRRIDIIAMRYTRNSSDIEECSLVVVKGAQSTATPQDPAMPATGKLLDGASNVYWPLYRITIDGLTPQAPEKMAEDAPVVTTGGSGTVPVSKGGTGAANAAGALSNLGIEAHIYADGDTGMWHWRKWTDGKCEMFGSWSTNGKSKWENFSVGGFPFKVHGGCCSISLWQPGNQYCNIGYTTAGDTYINFWAELYNGAAYFDFHLVGFTGEDI